MRSAHDLPSFEQEGDFMKPERDLWMDKIVRALSKLRQQNLEQLDAAWPSQTAAANQERKETRVAKRPAR